MQGIYLITNTINSKFYVGSSINIARRFVEHRVSCTNGRSKSPALQQAWTEHGGAAFTFSVLELVDGTKQELAARETHYIDHYRSYDPNFGYNILRKGYTFSEYIPSPEARIRMGAPRRGKPCPDHIKARISASQKGKPKSGEANAKNSASHMGAANGMYGRVPSAETIAKARQTAGWGAAHKASKRYCFLNPEGERFDIKGLKDFCRQQGLHAGQMCQLSQGKLKTHKGWRSA